MEKETYNKENEIISDDKREGLLNELEFLKEKEETVAEEERKNHNHHHGVHLKNVVVNQEEISDEVLGIYEEVKKFFREHGFGEIDNWYFNLSSQIRERKWSSEEIKMIEEHAHGLNNFIEYSAEENGEQLIEALKTKIAILRGYLKIIELKQESILQRSEIVAPQNFVSVFHETKEELLPTIDREGLKINVEAKNIGGGMVKRNAIIDKFRPEELKIKGITRDSIYGYLFLEYGHGLMGADRRFIKRDERVLRDEFESAQKYNPEFLKEFGVDTPSEYISKITNKEYLKSRYPGEILELKVDPQKSYVGDLEYITRIMDDINRGVSEDDAIQQQAKEYWKNLITLEDFLKFYKKPEWAKDGNSIKDANDYKDGEPLGTGEFYPIKGTPDNFPWCIHQPEVLIPDDIPQKHIKLIK